MVAFDLVCEFRHDLVLVLGGKAVISHSDQFIVFFLCTLRAHLLAYLPTRPGARSVLQAGRRAVPRSCVQLGLCQPAPLRLDERPLPSRLPRPRHPPRPPSPSPRGRGGGVRRRPVGRLPSRIYTAERCGGRREEIAACGEAARRRQLRGDPADSDDAIHVISAPVNSTQPAAKPNVFLRETRNRPQTVLNRTNRNLLCYPEDRRLMCCHLSAPNCRLFLLARL